MFRLWPKAKTAPTDWPEILRITAFNRIARLERGYGVYEEVDAVFPPAWINDTARSVAMAQAVCGISEAIDVADEAIKKREDIFLFWAGACA